MIPLKVGDIVRLRKPHPCGSIDWKVMRTGMDFRIQCLGCQHQAWIPRIKLETQFKGNFTAGRRKLRGGKA